ncbi:MAG: extracellular solute-binding protein [Clostridia bacterium]|nr:extracellular solute-binding protein [Clostridia bacterium]
MKKTNYLKIVSALLALTAAIFVFASCGKNETSNTKEASDEEHLDNLPDDLDFGGEQVNIFYWGHSLVTWELTSDGTTGDIVEKAVDQRNTQVQKRLGVTLNYIQGDPGVFMPIVRDEIMSGSTDYDLVVGAQCEAVSVAAAGAFRDLSQSKYLDLTKEYWNQEYNEALSVNEKRFLVGGDASLTTTAWASCLFFDKKNYSSFFGDEEEFYQFIYDGNWTLDEYAERCKQCYKDLNGNGVSDSSDQYGMGMNISSSNTDQYMFSSGVNLSYRDENNIPVVDMKNDKALEFCDKFYNLIYNNEGVLNYKNDEAAEVEGNMKYVFMAGTLQAIVEMRGDEDDFGVIPMPKLNANETEYHSWISDITGIWGVPITIDNDRAERACAVLECMASETRRLVLPQYYERALKNKYVRDSWSAKMLDLIHDGETTDFIAAMFNFNFMRSLISGGDPNYVSNYDAKEALLLKDVQSMFDAFEQNTTHSFVPETTTQASSKEIEDLTISDNQISNSWLTFGSKYKKSGILVKEDMSDKFAYVINDKDEIEVRSPDIKVAGGYYPTAAITSRETLPLADLSVTFRIDEGFQFNNNGWSSAMSVLWTDKPMESLPYYLECPGTNGLRESVVEDTTGLCVSFMGTGYTSGSVADLIYIIVYDGNGTRPEGDNRLGYRYTNWVNTDLGTDCTIEVKEDETLGYVVSINGTEYRTGLRGENAIDIDLTPLKDIEEGYITVGGESTDESFSNFTLSKINGKTAGSFFD